ncbi:hypothetical protein EVAR_62667_1 [Eumeta japonica]|uniref:Reverse transcriptase domain-containing protein n=1 Tax=Eumeta variegata TaxID=151549 RepID=A0A4C1YZ54_EUMVA|nr:hypothetical protein EVAR_62667_1 [Eumeta japonica]
MEEITPTHIVKTRKTSGLDRISNKKAIKCFSSPLLALLVTIFNACLKNYYFLNVWKEVPQGSTLFPLLYSACTNDILRPNSGVQLALSADDITLFLRSVNLSHIIPRLQRAIDELTQWF